jgi:hypothetical protein
MVTSASSGPRLHSSELIGDNGSAVGGDGPGVSDGKASVGVDVGPNAGGVLVLVGSEGGGEDVVAVQLEPRIMTTIRMESRNFPEGLNTLTFICNFFWCALPLSRNLSLILPSGYYRTIQLG